MKSRITTLSLCLNFYSLAFRHIVDDPPALLGNMERKYLCYEKWVISKVPESFGKEETSPTIQ